MERKTKEQTKAIRSKTKNRFKAGQTIAKMDSDELNVLAYDIAVELDSRVRPQTGFGRITRTFRRRFETLYEE